MSDESMTPRRALKFGVIETLIAGVFGGGVAWGTMTYSQTNQDKILDAHEVKIEQNAKADQALRTAINEIKIQNATITNEQKNQSKDIEQVLKMLERIEDKVQ